MPPALPRALVFDLDNTLYPRRSFVFSGFDAVAGHLERTRGVPRTLARQTLRHAHATSERGREFQVLCRELGLPRSLVAELVHVVRTHRPEIHLAREVALTLLRLRATWRLGVLTNGDPAIQARKVQALGVGKLVDAVVYAATCGARRGKPDAAPFRVALERLDTPACRTVFVGDDWHADIAGASRLGLRTIYLTTHPAAEPSGDLQMADAYVADVTSVPEIADTLIDNREDPWSSRLAVAASARASRCSSSRRLG